MTKQQILEDIATKNLIEIQHNAIIAIKIWLATQPISAEIENGIADEAIQAHKDYEKKIWLKN